MSSKGWVKWATSAAREVLMEDLQPRGMLHQMDDVTAAEAWEFYSSLAEFEGIQKDQFMKRLKDHRTQNNKMRAWAIEEEKRWRHDRRLHPRQATNERGEPVFDMDPAKQLLRADIQAGMHEKFKTPAKLQASRTEYKKFSSKIFRQRIYQEIRYQKMVRWMDKKRTEKRDKLFAKRFKAAKKEAQQENEAAHQKQEVTAMVTKLGKQSPRLRANKNKARPTIPNTTSKKTKSWILGRNLLVMAFDIL